MSELARVLLNLLILAEPLLTAAVLLVFLRSRRRAEFGAMRLYLTVRLAFALVLMSLLGGIQFSSGDPSRWSAAYFYTWLTASITLVGVLYRTMSSALSKILEPLPGLRRLGGVAFGWLGIAAAFLLVPSLAELTLSLFRGNGVVPEMMRLGRSLALAQLLAVTFTIVVAVKRRYPFFSWPIGILAGFAAEPVYGLVQSWLYDPHLWGWSNFWGQIVTDCVLLWWTLCFAIAASARAAAPTDAMLRWDQVARKAFRLRPGGPAGEGVQGNREPRQKRRQRSDEAFGRTNEIG